jgi:NAD(P)-dependent dehydrogenase (short-subunit alcohol dehydrogenase family)
MVINMDDFTGQVVLVTGAGGSNGRAIARRFTARGATVAANDITPINLDETIAGIQATAFVADVASKLAVQTMLHQILDRWERIDILVNCANVNPHIPILELDEWEWRRALDVNLSGVFFLMQSVGRVMKAQGGGTMINIAAGTQEENHRSAYVASMMGLAGLTQEAAREFAAAHIRVNMLCPGIRGKDAFPLPNEYPDFSAEEQTKLPPTRMDTPEDLAAWALFLSSQAAAQITGQIIK